MKSALFRRLLATALVLSGLTMAAIDYFLGSLLREQQVRSVTARLTGISQAIAREPDNAAFERGLAGAGIRIERVSKPAGNDPDLERALAGQTTSAVRSVSGETRCFVFTPSGKGVLIASEAINSQDINAARIKMLLAGLAATGLALLMALSLAESVARRVNRMKRFAEGLLDAPLDSPIAGPGDDLVSLERTLNRLAARLRELLEQWQHESSRSEAILSGMAEGVLAVDQDLRIVFCNDAVLRAMDVRRPVSVSGRPPLRELVRDSELVAILNGVVESGSQVKRNMKIPAGTGRIFEVQVAPFAVPQGRGALAIFYDLTDLERLEQVRKDFVANVSHEMRTPLAAIVGYSDTLLDGALEDEANSQRFVEVIRTNAIRLNSIASDLLVLSELESGIAPGEPDLVSVRDALESAMTTVESEAKSRGVRLLRGEIADIRVLGHRFRLEQAILNLLVNAVKFNREGGEVRISAVVSDDQVQIAVADTGVGIPSQDLPRIFERFYRVDKARSRQVGGTGLGLSIVRHAVERMNGKIKVDSQLGRGSVFTIILPAA